MAWKVLLITEDEGLVDKARSELTPQGHKVATITPSQLAKNTTLSIQPDWVIVDTRALGGLLNGTLEKVRRNADISEDRTIAVRAPGGPLINHRCRAKAHIPRSSSIAEVIEWLAGLPKNK
jgi:hypothetical protein